MYEYEKLLKEEGKTVADLPANIKSKITAIKMAVAKSAKNPTNQNMKDSVTKQDIGIAEATQTWLDGLTPPAPKETPEEKKEREEKAASEKAEKEKAAAEEAKKNNEMEARNKIVTIMNADSQRCIGLADLTNILGRAPGKYETIADLKIYNVYLTKKWKIQR